MKLFGKKKSREAKPWDREKLEAVMRVSICTGERTLGFRDKESGHITDIVLVRNDSDIERFKAEWGVDDVKEVY